MHWLYEDGIGEARAALIDDAGHLVAARIEPEGTLRVGTVAPGRLVERLSRGQGRVTLDNDSDVLVAAIPPGTTQGARLVVAVTREAIAERGRIKPPRGIVGEGAPRPGPDLLARCTASGLAVRRVAPPAPDALEAAGWSECLEEASGGDIAFPGGALRMSVTPAMTLFDVDGHLDPEPLALAAAAAVAAAIGRHGIGGSIGIDFPTLANRASRLGVATTLDAALAALAIPLAFERTAVNGFGFLQLIAPRARASLPELLIADPIRAAATALLRRLEREPPGAPAAHAVPAAVLRYLKARPGWLAELARRTGVHHRLEPR